MSKALLCLVIAFVAVIALAPIVIHAQDSTSTSIISDEALAVFGIPVGWLLTTIPLVVGWIAAIKSLFTNWLNSGWIPALNAVVSITYAYFTLRPNWLAVFVGSLALFLSTWTTWAGAKAAASAVGARPK